MKRTKRLSRADNNSHYHSQLKAKYKHTTFDLRNYNELLFHGITKHKEGTKTKLATMDKLHALFNSECKPPYCICLVPENFIDYKWNLDDLIEIFEFHLKHTVKKFQIRNIGKFILVEGYNRNKTWSPLLFWAKRLLKEDNSLSDEGERLYNLMIKKEIKGTQDLGSTTINKIAKELKEMEEKYEFIDTCYTISYPAGFISVFIRYIEEQMNRINFELVYINKHSFVNDFMRVAVKRNIFQKINRGVGYSTYSRT